MVRHFFLMKNHPRLTQKSIFDDADDTDFIQQLNEVGRQSLEDFKAVQNHLNKDVENGLLSQEDVDDITADFMKTLKQSSVQDIKRSEETIVVTFENSRLQIFDYVPLIMANIPMIAKRFLESKMLLKDIAVNRIHIGRISPENIDGIEITSVFYVTPYGSRIKIDLEHIYNLLLLIDFE
jgi:hypothetical protein